jgi:nucleoside 2-deoxyribosyltransferase
MSKIFISHSDTDKDYAQALAKELRKINFDGWLDTTELQPSKNWRAEITQAVESSDTVVTLLSADSVAQRNTMIELGMAWGLGKNIVPVVVPGQKLSEFELPMALHEVKVVEARQKSTTDIAAFVGQLSKPIR